MSLRYIFNLKSKLTFPPHPIIRPSPLPRTRLAIIIIRFPTSMTRRCLCPITINRRSQLPGLTLRDQPQRFLARPLRIQSNISPLSRLCFIPISGRVISRITLRHAEELRNLRWDVPTVFWRRELVFMVCYSRVRLACLEGRPE
jgi:hypothetical protein